MSMKEGSPLARDKKPRLGKGEDPLLGKDVLDTLLRTLEIDLKEPRYGLSASWEEIVGPEISPHVKVVDIRHGSLVLRADHPSWANLVLLQKKRIVKAVRDRYPSLGIRTLHVLGA
ncbi:MAG: DUF721 domain-containing protein [Spirochaetales bacterium]|nr:DUF721 domain-containing protein [Spirochaetales bacterium]